MKTRTIVSTLLFSGLATSPAWAASSWDLGDPWVREAPPGARVLAAYGILHNRGKRPGALVKVEAEGFGRVETHAMVRDGSMMRMKAVPRLVVPAGGEVRLEPGEWHWMLYEPSRTLTTDDGVNFVFVFSDGTRIERILPVRRYPTP